MCFIHEQSGKIAEILIKRKTYSKMISVFKNFFCFLLFFCVFHPRRRVWVKKPFMISLVRKYFSKYIKKFKVDEKAQAYIHNSSHKNE